ncbi:hypothetical protein NC651_012929 [Populus alba x Populus x berolinensis]|nr:hypothetical protein NC651_012929 [Populus alba x Populus x berolinensis]
MHRNCSANLKAKEAERSSQLENLTGELDNYGSALENKETEIKELGKELKNCHSMILQLKLQNEEASTMILSRRTSILAGALTIYLPMLSSVENYLQRQVHERRDVARDYCRREIRGVIYRILKPHRQATPRPSADRKNNPPSPAFPYANGNNGEIKV